MNNTNREVAPIVIENVADIRYKNFEGRVTKANRNGVPQFALFLDPELIDIQQLIDEGWNVKAKEFDEDDRPTEYYVYVDVNYNYRILPEAILIINPRDGEAPHGVRLDEETLYQLDDAVFTAASVVIRPRIWTDDDGRVRVKAYLQKLIAWSDPDYFQDALEGVIFD